MMDRESIGARMEIFKEKDTGSIGTLVDAGFRQKYVSTVYWLKRFFIFNLTVQESGLCIGVDADRYSDKNYCDESPKKQTNFFSCSITFMQYGAQFETIGKSLRTRHSIFACRIVRSVKHN